MTTRHVIAGQGPLALESSRTRTRCVVFPTVRRADRRQRDCERGIQAADSSSSGRIARRFIRRCVERIEGPDRDVGERRSPRASRSRMSANGTEPVLCRDTGTPDVLLVEEAPPRAAVNAFLPHQKNHGGGGGRGGARGACSPAWSASRDGKSGSFSAAAISTLAIIASILVRETGARTDSVRAVLPPDRPGVLGHPATRFGELGAKHS